LLSIPKALAAHGGKCFFQDDHVRRGKGEEDRSPAGKKRKGPALPKTCRSRLAGMGVNYRKCKEKGKENWRSREGRSFVSQKLDQKESLVPGGRKRPPQKKYSARPEEDRLVKARECCGGGKEESPKGGARIPKTTCHQTEGSPKKEFIKLLPKLTRLFHLAKEACCPREGPIPDLSKDESDRENLLQRPSS